MTQVGFLVLGNQLFDLPWLEDQRGARLFMAEHHQLCTQHAYHKQKLAMVLSAMRGYRDRLRQAGFTVDYQELAGATEGAEATFEASLGRWLDAHAIDALGAWAIEHPGLTRRIEAAARARDVQVTWYESPMFLCDRALVDDWLAGHRPHMASFYRYQRTRLRVLLDDDGGPAGGQWSFDADNRKPLPASVEPPGLPACAPDDRVKGVIDLVNQRYPDHPGQLSVDDWWLPTTREGALSSLDRFLQERFACFGPYEDALSERDPFLFHAVLTPTLNLGLLTPREVLTRCLAHAERHGTPIASVEGFVRQLIGWREFVRGVYRSYGERQATTNFFGHHRRLTDDWMRGTTGLSPLDSVIRKAQRWGWTHHIERLMVAGSLMTLCEVHPRDAYRWFMTMYVDSAAWVMGPNVYGMGIFSDGGIFATKPYICGSNYLLKMGDFEKPRAVDNEPTWCDVMDGLYWRFIDKHRDFFRGQARLGTAVASLDRMRGERRARIFAAAEAFLERTTTREPTA